MEMFLVMLLSLVARCFVGLIALVEGVTGQAPGSISGGTMCLVVSGFSLSLLSCLCWCLCSAVLDLFGLEFCCIFSKMSVPSILPGCWGGTQHPRYLGLSLPLPRLRAKSWLELPKTLGYALMRLLLSCVTVSLSRLASNVVLVSSLCLWKTLDSLLSLFLLSGQILVRAALLASSPTALRQYLFSHLAVWSDEEPSGVKPQVFVSPEAPVHPSTVRRCAVRYPPGHRQYRRQKTHLVVTVLAGALILLAFLLLSRAVPQSSHVVRYSMSCSLADTGPADIALPLVPAASFRSVHAYISGESLSLFPHWQHVQCVQSRVLIPVKSLASLQSAAESLQASASTMVQDFASAFFQPSHVERVVYQRLQAGGDSLTVTLRTVVSAVAAVDGLSLLFLFWALLFSSLASGRVARLLAAMPQERPILSLVLHAAHTALVAPLGISVAVTYLLLGNRICAALLSLVGLQLFSYQLLITTTLLSLLVVLPDIFWRDYQLYLYESRQEEDPPEGLQDVSTYTYSDYQLHYRVHTGRWRRSAHRRVHNPGPAQLYPFTPQPLFLSLRRGGSVLAAPLLQDVSHWWVATTVVLSRVFSFLCSSVGLAAMVAAFFALLSLVTRDLPLSHTSSAQSHLLSSVAWALHSIHVFTGFDLLQHLARVVGSLSQAVSSPQVSLTLALLFAFAFGLVFSLTGTVSKLFFNSFTAFHNVFVKLSTVLGAVHALWQRFRGLFAPPLHSKGELSSSPADVLGHNCTCTVGCPCPVAACGSEVTSPVVPVHRDHAFVAGRILFAAGVALCVLGGFWLTRPVVLTSVLSLLSQLLVRDLREVWAAVSLSVDLSLDHDSNLSARTSFLVSAARLFFVAATLSFSQLSLLQSWATAVYAELPVHTAPVFGHEVRVYFWDSAQHSFSLWFEGAAVFGDQADLPGVVTSGPSESGHIHVCHSDTCSHSCCIDHEGQLQSDTNQDQLGCHEQHCCSHSASPARAVYVPVCRTESLSADAESASSIPDGGSVIVMAGKQSTWWKSIPLNLSGMALHDNFRDFMRQCLVQHHEQPQDEEFFILDFELACGHGSPIHTLINTPTFTEELCNKRPKDFALELARQHKAERGRTSTSLLGRSAGPEYQQFVDMVNDAYPPYEDDPTVKADYDFWSTQARDTNRLYAVVQHACVLRDQLKAQLDAARVLHTTRDLNQRIMWLMHQKSPEHVEATANIKFFISTNKDVALLTGHQSTRHRHFDQYQIREVSDFKALDWLIHHVMSRHGSVTRAHSVMWRSRRMCKDQQPADAFAILCEEAETLAKLSNKRWKFDLDSELLDMVSRPDLGDGQAFWPPSLYAPLQQAMFSVQVQNPLLHSDPAEQARKWVETANHLWTDLMNRDTTMLAKITQELDKRGPWKTWTVLQAAFAKGTVTGASASSTADAGATGSSGQKGGQRIGRAGRGDGCKHCGAADHWARDCPQLKSQMRSPSPARALTTTPTPGADQRSIGMNPKAAYNRQGSQATASQAPSAPARVQSHCTKCSGVAGRDVRHGGTCFLSCPIADVPEWFNPLDEKLRAAVNQRRKIAGLPIPAAPQRPQPQTAQPASPGAERRARFAEPASGPRAAPVRVCGPRVMMMHARRDSNSARVIWHADLQSFDCAACGNPMSVHRVGASVKGVSCGQCNVNIPASELPQHMLHPAHWKVEASSTVSGAAAPFGSSVSAVPPARSFSEATQSLVRTPDMLRISQGDPGLSVYLQRFVNREIEALAFLPCLLRFVIENGNSVQRHQLYSHAAMLAPVAQRSQQMLMWRSFVPDEEAATQAPSNPDFVPVTGASSLQPPQESSVLHRTHTQTSLPESPVGSMFVSDAGISTPAPLIRPSLASLPAQLQAPTIMLAPQPSAQPPAGSLPPGPSGVPPAFQASHTPTPSPAVSAVAIAQLTERLAALERNPVLSAEGEVTLSLVRSLRTDLETLRRDLPSLQATSVATAARTEAYGTQLQHLSAALSPLADIARSVVQHMQTSQQTLSLLQGAITQLPGQLVSAVHSLYPTPPTGQDYARDITTLTRAVSSLDSRVRTQQESLASLQFLVTQSATRGAAPHSDPGTPNAARATPAASPFLPVQPNLPTAAPQSPAAQPGPSRQPTPERHSRPGTPGKRQCVAADPALEALVEQFARASVSPLPGSSSDSPSSIPAQSPQPSPVPGGGEHEETARPAVSRSLFPQTSASAQSAASTPVRHVGAAQPAAATRVQPEATAAATPPRRSPRLSNSAQSGDPRVLVMRPGSPADSTSSSLASLMRRHDGLMDLVPGHIDQHLVAMGLLAPSEAGEDSRPPSRCGSIAAVQPLPAVAEIHPARLEKDNLQAHLQSTGKVAQFAQIQALSDARVRSLTAPASPHRSPGKPTHMPESAASPVRESTSRRIAAQSAPLNIIPELQPSISVSSLTRISEGTYRPTESDERAHAEFSAQKNALHFLSQEDRRYAFLLYSHSGEQFFMPKTVMTDTGADLYLCITSYWAKQCGLTWGSQPAQLVGIGGISNVKGIADQKVMIQLGSNGDPGLHKVSPLEGVFTFHCRPYIVNDRFQRDIGAEVLIGGSLLRACLGRPDYLGQNLEYSPAWHTHKCADLTCMLPMRTAVPLSPEGANTLAAIRVLGSLAQIDPLQESLTPDGQTSNGPWTSVSELAGQRKRAQQQRRQARQIAARQHRNFDGAAQEAYLARKAAQKQRRAQRNAAQPSSTAVTATTPASQPQSVRRSSLLARAISAARSALSPSGLPPAKAAPMHPGFPQTPSAPTPQQYHQRGARVAAQTAVRDALRLPSNPHAFAAAAPSAVISPLSVTPLGIVYPVDQLRSTGRLREGGVLDLSPSLTPEDRQSIVNAVTELVLAKLAANPQRPSFSAVVRSPSAQPAAPTDTAFPTLSRSAPPHTLSQTVHAPSNLAPQAAVPGGAQQAAQPTAEQPQPAAARPTSNAGPSGASKGKQRAAVTPASRHGMRTRSHQANADAAGTSSDPIEVMTTSPRRPSILRRPVEQAVPRSGAVPTQWHTTRPGIPLAEAVEILMAQGIQPGLTVRMLSKRGSSL